MRKIKLGDHVIVFSGNILGFEGIVKRLSKRTGSLTVEVNLPAGPELITVMPYEVRPLEIQPVRI